MNGDTGSEAGAPTPEPIESSTPDANADPTEQITKEPLRPPTYQNPNPKIFTGTPIGFTPSSELIKDPNSEIIAKIDTLTGTPDGSKARTELDPDTLSGTHKDPTAKNKFDSEGLTRKLFEQYGIDPDSLSDLLKSPDYQEAVRSATEYLGRNRTDALGQPLSDRLREAYEGLDDIVVRETATGFLIKTAIEHDVDTTQALNLAALFELKRRSEPGYPSESDFKDLDPYAGLRKEKPIPTSGPSDMIDLDKYADLSENPNPDRLD